MPHKRNPVLSENLTGLSRLVRSAVTPALENVALWHERDISHSAAERVFAPDFCMALDFSLHRLAGIIENLLVYPERMKANLETYWRLGFLPTGFASPYPKRIFPRRCLPHCSAQRDESLGIGW